MAKFYRDAGNFHAAYLRAKDAVKLIPDDPEAHFLLGESAQKLQLKEEATAELNTYLKLEPEGDHVRAARRALEALK